MTHGGRSAAATLEVSTRATLFMRDLDLPRDREREVVDDARDRTYTLRGSETRALSTVGAFRVVRARDRRGRRGSARAKRFEISGEPKRSPVGTASSDEMSMSSGVRPKRTHSSLVCRHLPGDAGNPFCRGAREERAHAIRSADLNRLRTSSRMTCRRRRRSSAMKHCSDRASFAECPAQSGTRRRGLRHLRAGPAPPNRLCTRSTGPGPR